MTEKLHTLARRYCIERSHYWSTAYESLAARGKDRKGDGYTDEALNIFPRYQVLNAILIEVERLDPDSFPTLEEARELICLAGRTAETIFTEPPHGDIQAKAMQEEREAFCRYVLNFPDSELAGVEPLFYRRVLSPQEAQKIWERVKKTWGIENASYWYPLAGDARGDVLAVQDSYFYEELGVDKLRAILSGHGVSRVWELREFGSEPEYEMELSIFEPHYGGAEGYWCSEGFDWLIYASHEGSITFGGLWLIEEIKQAWPSPALPLAPSADGSLRRRSSTS